MVYDITNKEKLWLSSARWTMLDYSLKRFCKGCKASMNHFTGEDPLVEKNIFEQRKF
jgi:hypothetical protein